MKELALSDRMPGSPSAKTMLAALMATTALMAGAQALAPGSAAGMTPQEECEGAAGFEWSPITQECQYVGGSGGGGPSNGGVGGGGGGTGGGDLWDGWQLDQGSGNDPWEDWTVDEGVAPETPEQKWAREEREAEERYQVTVKKAKEQLDEVRVNLLLERVQWMERQNERANRDRDRESGPDKSSRGKKSKRQARRPPV